MIWVSLKQRTPCSPRCVPMSAFGGFLPTSYPSSSQKIRALSGSREGTKKQSPSLRLAHGLIGGFVLDTRPRCASEALEVFNLALATFNLGLVFQVGVPCGLCQRVDHCAPVADGTLGHAPKRLLSGPTVESLSHLVTLRMHAATQPVVRAQDRGCSCRSWWCWT